MPVRARRCHLPSHTFVCVPSGYTLDRQRVVSVVPQFEQPPGMLPSAGAGAAADTDAVAVFGPVGVGVSSLTDRLSSALTALLPLRAADPDRDCCCCCWWKWESERPGRADDGIDLTSASKAGLLMRSLARLGDIFPSAWSRSRKARRCGVVGGGERGRGKGGGVTWRLWREGGRPAAVCLFGVV